MSILRHKRALPAPPPVDESAVARTDELVTLTQQAYEASTRRAVETAGLGEWFRSIRTRNGLGPALAASFERR